MLLNLAGCASSFRVDWSSEESKREIVISQRSVVNGERPILTVLRDSVSGQWTFITDENPQIDVPTTVTVGDILKLDETIREVSDLPPGWIAIRKEKGAPWVRRKF